MNDDFLKNYAKRPNPQFSENLYRRLERRERKIAVMRKLALSFTALIIVFTAVFAASPTVRAATLEFLREIGGLAFTVSDEPPSVETEGVIPPTFEDVPLSEAKSRFAGPIDLPQYIPGGFELQPLVRLTSISELADHHFARLTWRRLEIISEGNEIEIFITLEIDYAPGVETPGYYVGQDSVKAVDLNGRQGALIRGVWDHERQAYIAAPFSFFIWKYDDDTTYTLSANNELVEDQELIRMAQSIH
jgi:hypothetical protein